jgi:hypothetical protein
MTNEEKVEQYKKEIEAVFLTEKAINALNSIDKLKEQGDEESIKLYDMLTLRGKEYWVKFTVTEPNILNSFLKFWVQEGFSIAGVKGQILDADVCNKQELRIKLSKFINEL